MADFYTAVALTLVHEGGLQKDANDRGNWTGGKVGEGILKGTKYGISAREFPDQDIENLTQGMAEQIYLNRYWNPLYSQIIDQPVTNKIFDMGVLFGETIAVEQMQIALRSTWPVKVDGIFGEITLNQINNSEPVSLLVAYKTVFVAHAISVGAHNPAERSDVAGWINRINS